MVYTLFALAQWLGFLEVVRREGPRERSFLALANPQGTDTLTALCEGFRFALATDPDTLQVRHALRCTGCLGPGCVCVLEGGGQGRHARPLLVSHIPRSSGPPLDRIMPLAQGLGGV